MLPLELVYDMMYNRIEARFGGKVVIAGGAVRDYHLNREPRDFDVFWLVPDNFIWSITDLRNTISCNGVNQVRPTRGYNEQTGVWPLAEVIFPSVPTQTKVQLMMPEARSIERLLATFDWNICKFAYDGEFHGEDPSILEPGSLLVPGTQRDPVRSAQRGREFAERYNLVYGGSEYAPAYP